MWEQKITSTVFDASIFKSRDYDLACDEKKKISPADGINIQIYQSLRTSVNLKRDNLLTCQSPRFMSISRIYIYLFATSSRAYIRFERNARGF